MAGDERLGRELTAVITNLLATKAAALDGYARNLLKSMEMELVQESTNQSGEGAHAATVVSRSCLITDQFPPNWATAVRAICDDLEDHIDIYILKAAARSAARPKSLFAEMIARRNLRKRFEVAKARAFELLEEWSSSIPEWDQPSDPAAKALVGRRDDVNVLVTKLIEGGHQRCVISVVGAAGSGKTTLAYHVFHHWRVQRHFGTCLAWAKASVPMGKIKTVLAHLLLQVMEGQDEEERVGAMDEKELADRLSLLLRGRRYLMMLDGVSDLQNWGELSLVFPPGTQGSRVLLTTSNENVASQASGHQFIHRLQPLSEEDSWKLFCAHAFPDGKSSVGPRLEESVKTIYVLTHGLPQAVATAGRYMLFQYSHHLVHKSWSSFAGPKNFYLPMLVDILPYSMKLCLLYLIAFPIDRPILTRQLIPMWAGEGFLQLHTTRTQEGVESAGHQVLETLAGMNLITISRSVVGHIKTILVRPDLHRYMVHFSIKDDFLIHLSTRTFQRRCNAAGSFTRSIISHDDLYFHDVHKSTLLRVVRIEDLRAGRKEVPMTHILNQKLLRYLKLSISSSIDLSPIGNIPQLQNLDLRNTPIYTLPPSFRELRNLWYLDLRGTYITRLPSAIEEMQQLRHLYVDKEAARDGPCPNFSSLTNVETMLVVPVGAWIENGLGMLASLKKLGLHGDYSLCQGMLSRALLSLPCLQTLRLDFGFGDTSPAMARVLPQLPLLSLYVHGRFDVPLNPHHLFANLRKLSLRWCGLELDPMEALGRLPELRVLRLGPGSYLGKELVCRRRGFKQLTTLEFDLLDSLEEWTIEDESMVVLENMSIRGCRRLYQVPDGVKNISTLQTLELLRMSHKFYARSRDEGGEDWHKISHVHSILFEQDEDLETPNDQRSSQFGVFPLDVSKRS